MRAPERENRWNAVSATGSTVFWSPHGAGTARRPSAIADANATRVALVCGYHRPPGADHLDAPLLSAAPPQGVSTMCDLTRESPWQRASLIDDVVDHLSVVEAAEHGALAALEVVAARCEMLGVPDATVSEVLRSWLACRAT